MINETLEFMAKCGLEVMIAQNMNEVEVGLTPNTTTGSIDLKIGNTPFSMKSKHIANTLKKQNLGFLMDKRIGFTATVSAIPTGEEFNRLRENDSPIEIGILPKTSFAKKFLEAYSREEPSVSIPVVNLPKFENPQL